MTLLFVHFIDFQPVFIHNAAWVHYIPDICLHILAMMWGGNDIVNLFI